MGRENRREQEAESTSGYFIMSAQSHSVGINGIESTKGRWSPSMDEFLL